MQSVYDHKHCQFMCVCQQSEEEEMETPPVKKRRVNGSKSAAGGSARKVGGFWKYRLPLWSRGTHTHTHTSENVGCFNNYDAHFIGIVSSL